METKDIRFYRGSLDEFKKIYGKKSSIVKTGSNKTLENEVIGCIPADYTKTRLDTACLLSAAEDELKEHGYMVDMLESIGADSVIRYKAVQNYRHLIVISGIPVKREHD